MPNTTLIEPQLIALTEQDRLLWSDTPACQDSTATLADFTITCDAARFQTFKVIRTPHGTEVWSFTSLPLFQAINAQIMRQRLAGQTAITQALAAAISAPRA